MDPKPNARTKRWHVVAGICLLNGYRKGAELGVSHGRFTSFLCGVMHDMQMIAVDLWQEQPSNTAEGSETYVGWAHEQAYENFKLVCSDYYPGRVEIRRMTTVEAAKDVEDASLDFVFIDANHSYEGCKADIEAWAPKVRKGGCITGHDLNWPPVAKAVTEAFGEVQALRDNVWVHIQK